MIINKQRFFFNFLNFIIIIFVLSIWSSSVLTDWGSDFGTYYAGSYFLNDNYNLYNEYFDHKGPFYYLFLKMIGYFIGWGHWQAYLSLLLTMLVFYLPVFFILVSERLEPIKFFVGTILSLCLLYDQYSNSGIAFFQSGLLLTSFWLLVRHYKSLIIQNISFFLFICAVLTRIDSLIFLPIYFATLILADYPKKFNFFIKNIFFWIITLIISFSAISRYFHFNVNDFLIFNNEFNKWYLEYITISSSLFYKVIDFIIRENSFKILTSSLIIIPLLLLTTQLSNGIYELFIRTKNFLLKRNEEHFISKNTFCLLIIMCGLMGWIITTSDKSYHILILLAPLLLFYLFNLHFLSVIQSSILSLIGVYCLIIILYMPIYKLHKNPNCLTSPFCKSSNLNYHYEDIFKFLKDIKDKEITILGANGWIYLFSDKKPATSISNWVFYYAEKPFVTNLFTEQHQILLKRPSGYRFLIINKFLEMDNKNKFLKEVLNKSQLLEKKSKFSVFEIK